jgi:hypothetical protein
LPKDGITSKIFEWKVDKAVLKEKKENEVVKIIMKPIAIIIVWPTL